VEWLAVHTRISDLLTNVFTAIQYSLTLLHECLIVRFPVPVSANMAVLTFCI